jgi:hypothetical protein
MQRIDITFKITGINSELGIRQELHSVELRSNTSDILGLRAESLIARLFDDTGKLNEDVQKFIEMNVVPIDIDKLRREADEADAKHREAKRRFHDALERRHRS